jgi:mono/diheme cytochrome c family protein
MKRVLKLIGFTLLGMVVLLVIVMSFLYLRTSSRMDQRFDIQPIVTSVQPDSMLMARGKHVMEVEACQHCHGENLGGQVLMDMPLWRMSAPNLTSGRGGIGRTYSVADWDRAIRSGVAKNGRGLRMMPADVYHNLSNEDTRALIAYLQQIAPVDNELPNSELRFLGAVMLGAGGFDPAENVYEPGLARETTPAHEPSAELGEYWTSVACQGCHGEQFGGKKSDDPNCPPAPSLVAASAWDVDDFRTTIRTGVNPGGRELIDQCMPWSSFKEMTDIELEAVHVFLKQTLNPGS